VPHRDLPRAQAHDCVDRIVRAHRCRGEDAFTVRNVTRDASFQVRHDLSDRQVRVLLAGGLINDFRARAAAGSDRREGPATTQP